MPPPSRRCTCGSFSTRMILRAHDRTHVELGHQVGRSRPFLALVCHGDEPRCSPVGAPEESGKRRWRRSADALQARRIVRPRGAGAAGWQSGLSRRLMNSHATQSSASGSSVAARAGLGRQLSTREQTIGA